MTYPVEKTFDSRRLHQKPFQGHFQESRLGYKPLYLKVHSILDIQEMPLTARDLWGQQ